MKIRSGFVSNSSSSSFILIFDKLPESEEELMQVLNFEETPSPLQIGPLQIGGFAPERYAERIFGDIQEAGEPDEEEIVELLGNDLYLDIKDLYHKAWDEKDEAKREELHEAADARWEELKAEKFEEFQKKYTGKIIRIVGYSDNEGSFDASLEHDDLFANIEHIYINQH